MKRPLKVLPAACRCSATASPVKPFGGSSPLPPADFPAALIIQ
jgi:hypothetical protein